MHQIIRKYMRDHSPVRISITHCFTFVPSAGLVDADVIPHHAGKKHSRQDSINPSILFTMSTLHVCLERYISSRLYFVFVFSECISSLHRQDFVSTIPQSKSDFRSVNSSSCLVIFEIKSKIKINRKKSKVRTHWGSFLYIMDRALNM